MSTSLRPAYGYAALEKGGTLVPWSFERRALRDKDVAVKILYAGICHSDIHSIKKWASEYPLVPGHEMTGVVIETGSKSKKFKVGDLVAIGNIVDSCRVCEPCQKKMESYCREYPTLTYDGLDRIDKTRTRGGYSDHYVADEDFVYAIPEGLDPAGVAPLLCAGITTYSPLRHWNISPGKTVGVIGIGGLGHIAIKMARAMGAHVVAFTTTASKAEEAQKLGAHEVAVSKDADQMKAQGYRFDFILDTVSEKHPLDPYITALKLEGTLCVLGIPESYDFTPLLLTIGRRTLSSSGSGGTLETAEMLKFCQEHQIVADVEVIDPKDVNTALARLEKGDVRYRFVMDMSKLKAV